jgi:hypothetical protein
VTCEAHSSCPPPATPTTTTTVYLELDVVICCVLLGVGANFSTVCTCRCGRACTHTLAAIQALLPRFTKRYHVLSNNCKAFVMAVLEVLVGAGGPACLSSEQLRELRSYLEDAKLVDGIGRGVDATMRHVSSVSSALQQNLSSTAPTSAPQQRLGRAAPSSRRPSTRAA